MGVPLDLEIVFATFARRYVKYRENRHFDNSALPAGSPMHYFCRGCYKEVAVKPECWFLDPPPKYCEACEALAVHGLLDEAKEWMADKMRQELGIKPLRNHVPRTLKDETDKEEGT